MRLKPKVKLFLYILIVLVCLGIYFFFRQAEKEYNSITTFQECVDAGYPIINAVYPEQCKIPGKLFVNTTQTASPTTVATSSSNTKSYKNISYMIEGQPITLQNGKASVPITPDSSSTNEIQYFGNEVRGDFDGNGTEDIAFLLTDKTSGSGTFFYVVVALLDENQNYTGTNAILLGDRIAPQTTELKNGEIIVNYADRKPTDPMTTRPSVGVSKHYKVINKTLVEVTE